MSIVEVSLSWFKQTFSWSNSRESWQERLLGAALLLAGVGLCFLAYKVPLWVSVALWGTLLVAAAVLLRQGWFTLFGPVLFYDMVRTARRNRYFLLRCVYAGFLLLILFWVWTTTSWRSQPERLQAAAIAMFYFESFAVVQFLAVLVLTPAYVAGSIAEEKDRKTLEFLLATDLRNREIVLSKLGSRLANLGLFLLTGLPILSFLQFLGGIDPDLVLASFAATAITAVGLASVSILQSVLCKRPRDAIALTYLIVIAYYFLSSMLWGLKFSGHWFFELPLSWGSDPYTVGALIEVFRQGNAFIALVMVANAGQLGALGTTLPSLLADYALFHGTLALLCVGWSILRLRALALRQSFGKVERLRWYHRLRPPVGGLPALWKELHVEGGLRVNWAGYLFVVLLVLLTIGLGVFFLGAALWDFFTHPNGFRNDFAEIMNVWTRLTAAGVACLLLVGVAVRASTTIRSEIDRDTFDALVTTPLSSDAILLAKFVGSLFSVRLGWLWLGAVLGLGVLSGGLHVLAVPLFLGAWVVYACFFALVGLWFSMVSRSMMRATVYTMLTTVFFGFGHWFLTLFCCLPMFFLLAMGGGPPGDLPEYLAKFQAGLTPPFALFAFAYPSWDVTFPFGRRDFGEMAGFCLLGLFLYGTACLMLWFVLIAPRFRQMTRRDQTSAGDE